MKPYYLIFLLILFSGSLFADTPDPLFIQANKAYISKNYEEAFQAYETLIKKGEAGAFVYGNAANSAYYLDRMGLALLYSKKALMRAPRDADLRANHYFILQHTHATNNTSLNIESVIEKTFFWSSYLTGHELWLVTLSAYFLLCLFVILFLVFRKNILKKGFFFSFILFLLCLSGLLTNLLFLYNPQDHYIVEKQVPVYPSFVSSEPSDVLADGTKVRVKVKHGMGEGDQWLFIHYGNGKKGWLRSVQALPINL